MVQLKEGEKYEIVEKKTRSKCKIEFILSIFNVTENDGGTYSCHWLCEDKINTKAAVDLKVFDDLPTGKIKRKGFIILSLDCSILLLTHMDYLTRDFYKLALGALPHGNCLVNDDLRVQIYSNAHLFLQR